MNFGERLLGFRYATRRPAIGQAKIPLKWPTPADSQTGARNGRPVPFCTRRDRHSAQPSRTEPHRSGRSNKRQSRSRSGRTGDAPQPVPPAPRSSRRGSGRIRRRRDGDGTRRRSLATAEPALAARARRQAARPGRTGSQVRHRVRRARLVRMAQEHARLGQAGRGASVRVVDGAARDRAGFIQGGHGRRLGHRPVRRAPNRAAHLRDRRVRPRAAPGRRLLLGDRGGSQRTVSETLAVRRRPPAPRDQLESRDVFRAGTATSTSCCRDSTRRPAISRCRTKTG